MSKTFSLNANLSEISLKSSLFGSHIHPRSIVGSTGISTALFPHGRCSRPRRLRHSRCYASISTPDPRVSVAAATQILDRAYGRPVQSIDANINEDPVRYIVELPEKSATTEEWLESIRREDAGRALVTGVAAAVDDEQTH